MPRRSKFIFTPYFRIDSIGSRKDGYDGVDERVSRSFRLGGLWSKIGFLNIRRKK